MAALLPSLAHAADYRVTAEQPTVLYDGPSAKAKPLFLYGRDVPVELIVTVEGWAKVRDAGGTIGWIDRKGLSDKRMVVVRDAARRRARIRATMLRRSSSAPSATCCSSSPRPRRRRRRPPFPVGEGAAPRRRVRLRADHAGVRLLARDQRCARASRSSARARGARRSPFILPRARTRSPPSGCGRGRVRSADSDGEHARERDLPPGRGVAAVARGHCGPGRGCARRRR